MFLVTTGCFKTLKHETERSRKKDIRDYIDEPAGQLQLDRHVKAYLEKPDGEQQLDAHTKTYLDNNFNSYANDHENRRIEERKKLLKWTLSVVGITVSIMGGIAGLITVNKKLKGNNENV